jgi:hypothetical protein
MSEAARPTHVATEVANALEPQPGLSAERHQLLMRRGGNTKANWAVSQFGLTGKFRMGGEGVPPAGQVLAEDRAKDGVPF